MLVHIEAATLILSVRQGSGGGIDSIAHPTIYESNFIHHDFVQFWKHIKTNSE